MEFVRTPLTGLAMVAGMICAGAALAAHGGRWSPRLDVFTHFAPIWLAGGLAVALYALALGEPGSRRGLIALGVTAAALAALLIAPEFRRPRGAAAAADAPGQIKLIQFNAWRDNADLAPVLDWLAAQDADIIVLQEAERLRDPLVRRTGYHLAFGSESVAILSKTRPIAAGIDLPPDRPARPPLVRATFEGPGAPFTVVATHYAWPIYGGFQEAQGRVVGELLAQFPSAGLILSGDFNSTPWSFARRREDRLFGLERRTRALFSWPAGAYFPLLPVDHVYAGRGWRTVSVTRGPAIGSDHFPVVVILAASVEP